MLKRLGLAAWLLLAACAPVFAQAGQAGANQIWGNATAGPKAPKANNIGSFLTPGAGISITGTPKATIGITNAVTAAGPMGSATQTVVLTYNAQGQITAATLATIAPPFTAITGSLACSQMPALTGNVTTSAGACATTIGAGVVTFSNMATASLATAANFLGGTASTILTSDVVYQPFKSVTYAAALVIDFSTGSNFQINPVSGNITSVTINNIKPGQAGTIQLIQDGTGGRTLPATFNTNFKFAGGVQPVASTGAGAADVVFYTCYLTNYCLASFSKAFQ